MKDKEEEIREFINQQITIIDEIKTEQLRYNALSSISFLKGDVVTKKLLQVFLEDESEELRGEASIMLQERYLEGDISRALIPSYAKAIMDAVTNEKSITIRGFAAWALGWLGVDYSTKKIVSFLTDTIKKEKDRDVCSRASAAMAMIANENEEGKNLIFKNIKSEDFKIKFWSTIALFQCERPATKILSLIDEFRQSAEIDSYYTKVIDSYIRKKTIDRNVSEVQEKLKDTEQAIKDQPDSSEKEISLVKFQSLEETIQDLVGGIEAAKIEREALRKEFFSTRRSIEDSFRKRDYLEVKGHRETLQTQINLLSKDLTYVKKRADEKITIKDEFAGAWKMLVILSLLASIVLIVLKIIEAVRNSGI